MKKIFFTVLLTILGMTFQSWAQESAFQFSVGYGFPSGSQKITEESVYTSSGTTASSTASGVYGSYGSGTNVSASFTRMFSKHMGLDLSASYLFGKEYSARDNFSSTSSSSTSTFLSSSSGLYFSPTLVLQAGESKVKPYMKMGFALGFVSLDGSSQSTNVSSGTTQVSTMKIELSGGTSFGFRGGFGLSFEGTKKVGFFTELLLTSMTYYPNEGALTESTLNGVDQLAGMSVSSKQTIFKTELTSSSASVPNPAQPSQAIQPSFALGSISINAGMKIRLGPAKE